MAINPDQCGQFPRHPRAREADYFIAAGSSNGGVGTYRVTATNVTPAVVDDYSNTTSTAGRLSVGGSTTGNIEVVNDTDWFRVSLVAGQVYQFDLLGSPTSNGTLSDPYMSLRNPSGSSTRLIEDDNSGTGNNSQFTYTVTTSGDYFIAAGSSNGGVGTYRVTATNVTPPTDTVAPVISSFAPADGSTGVAVGANLALTFNEAVRAGTGNVVIYNSNGTVFRTIAVTDTTQVTFSGSTMTINPAVNLAAGAGYYVQLASGVVRDTAGNNFAGITSTTQFNFTTANAVTDAGNTLATATALTLGGIVSQSVGIGTDVDDYFRFTATQNGSVRANLTGLSADIDLRALNSAGTQIVASELGGTSSEVVNFTVVAGQTYYLRVDPFNAVSSNYSLATTFTPTATDTTAPVVSSYAPADNSTGVAVGANLVLTFNEAVRAGTGNVVIYNSNGTVFRTIAVTDTTQVTFSGSTMTINPAVNLAAGAGYYVQLASGVVRDTAGNNFAGITSTTQFNFTTASTPGISVLYPFAGNYAVTQTQTGTFSHTDDPSNPANPDYWTAAYDFGAPTGTPVLAVAGGTVVSVYEATPNEQFGPGHGQGNFVTVLFNPGTQNQFYGTFAHLSFDSVKPVVGQTVIAGEIIALSGNTGASTGAHVHFGYSSTSYTHPTSTPSVPIIFANATDSYDSLINFSGVQPSLNQTVSGQFTGGSGNDTLSGNTAGNAIVGNGGADVISGLGGDDLLFGGLGNDALSGGSGRDAFIFDSTLGSVNNDTITDFSVVDDTIRLRTHSL